MTVPAVTPKITGAILFITGVLTGLQFVFPAIVSALQRTPAALSSGEWWRLITPIFVERGGWEEIAVNMVSLGVIGVIVEKLWGGGRWLVFYVTGGLVGESAGMAWRPYGAGSSVAVCGLLGALAVSLLLRTSSRSRVGGAVILLGGLALTGLRNLHGPPLLAAACVAGFMQGRGRTASASRSERY